MSVRTMVRTKSEEITNPAATVCLAGEVAHARQKSSDEEQFRLTQVRAYDLWEQAGKPDGDEARDRFWFEAESEMVTSDE